MEKLLFGLGIRNVGAKTAKVLARQFKNIDKLMKASLEELININDIGETIAKSIIDYFNDEENIYIINRLKELNVNMEYINDSLNEEKSEFIGKTFVLTGTLMNITRDEATIMIENLGGKVVSSVSSKTFCVIVGENSGSKYDKARSLNIPIWQEEFMEKIRS